MPSILEMTMSSLTATFFLHPWQANSDALARKNQRQKWVGEKWFMTKKI